MATAAGALGVWDWNFVTNELFVDRKLKSLLGFDDAEISTRPDDWGSRVHPEDLSSAAALVQACIAGQSDVYELEHRMLHKDGSVKWFLSRGSAVRGTDGVLHRLVGTKVDITERKRAAELFRLAIEAAPAGMITVDSGRHDRSGQRPGGKAVRLRALRTDREADRDAGSRSLRR